VPKYRVRPKRLIDNEPKQSEMSSFLATRAGSSSESEEVDFVRVLENCGASVEPNPEGRCGSFRLRSVGAKSGCVNAECTAYDSCNASSSAAMRLASSASAAR
jgi:hypothetical protein